MARSGGLVLILGVLSLVKASIFGQGTVMSLLSSWVYSYRSIEPDFAMDYNKSRGGPNAIRAMIDGTGGVLDFALLDSLVPTPADFELNPNVQLFPLVSTSLVPQINIPAIASNPTPLVLSREAMALIFMGVIYKWNDQLIKDTNPDLASLLPDSNITVVYRTLGYGVTAHATSLLSAFSPLWASTYGIVQSWPAALVANPNFVPGTSNTVMNAKIIALPNSIGYVSYPYVARDSTIRSACVQNTLGQTVCPTPQTVADAVQNIPLDPKLELTYVLDDNPDAWPSGAFFSMLVHTDPPQERCTDLREFYKFIRWILLDDVAHDITLLGGYSPLGPEVAGYVLNILSKIECSSRSVLVVEAVDKRGPIHSALIIFNSVFFAFVIILSFIHLYLFRSSTMNEVYTVVFLLGAIVTLSAPYAWNMIPNQNSVCLARAWLTSMGLSLLLGSLFSRTSQLRDIYLLQKKTIDNLQNAITVRSSLIRLGFTLFLVTFTNFLVLLLWTAVDPYTATFNPSDSELHGLWTCSSNHMKIWMSLQVTFLMFLIFFGVYVIYKTWSFQRQAIIRETRWVLMVLYNIVLNVVAAFPSAYISKANDENLAVLMIASLMFSGGGIVLAFLLPRILRRWRHRNDGKNSHSRESQGEAQTAKLKVKVRDPTESPHHNSSSPHLSEVNGDTTRGFSSSVSLRYLSSETTPTTPTYSPNMRSINEEIPENSDKVQAIELLTVKQAIAIRRESAQQQQQREELDGRSSREETEEYGEEDLSQSKSNERRQRQLEVSITPATRQLDVSSRQSDLPLEERHLLESPDRSPPATKLLWSSNPLAGTETPTPMEEDSRDL